MIEWRIHFDFFPVIRVTLNGKKFHSLPMTCLSCYKLNQCQTLKFSSTSPSATSPLAGLSWSSTLTLSPRLLRTSEPCVLERRELARVGSPCTSRDPFSTELSLNLCSKVVTSPTLLALVVSQSTALSSLMRTSSTSTLALVSCPWLTPDPTPTDLSSSSALSHAPGSTASTSCSVRSLRA